ncbi:MAG: response regulator transcription factor, partial [Solirubrobacterales bacterium]
SDPVRVVTVDDFEPFLEVAREVVLAAPGFEPAREVTCARDALAAAAEVEPGLMIVDVHMPEMGGVELTRRIRASHPDVMVVLISARDVADIASEARDCGAVDVVRKQDFVPELLTRLWREHGDIARE